MRFAGTWPSEKLRFCQNLSVEAHLTFCAKSRVKIKVRVSEKETAPAVGHAKGQKEPTAEVAADAWVGQTMAPASSPQARSPSEKPGAGQRRDGHSNSHDTCTSFILHVDG